MKKTRIFSSRKAFASFWMIVLLAFFSVSSYAISDAEKAQKRDELDRYFSSALLQAKPEVSKKARQTFRWTAHGSTRVGFDTNVDLKDGGEDDAFYEERLSAHLQIAPEGMAIAGLPASLGIKGRYSYFGYFDRNDLNRQHALASPYLRLDLKEDLFLETAYQWRARLYDSRDELDYFANGGKVSLEHRLGPQLSHKASFTYENLDYFDRLVILSDGSAGGSDREDDRYEVTYGFHSRVANWTFNLEGVWTWNDSSDEYFDYNDYEDAGLDGSVSVRLTRRFILTGFGGWHRRMYDDRAIAPSFTTVQDDDWFYGGARLFFSLNKWVGMDISFTYYENDSNDPGDDYDTTLTSAGLHLYF
jgi:hypothetical protein